MSHDLTRRTVVGGVVTFAAVTPTAGVAAAAQLPVFESSGALIKALADGHVSSAELVDAAIARIELLDSDINAVVVRDFERARAAAKLADEARARGARHPLLGIPITVKEAFNVVGLSTTWGNPANKGWEPKADALAVARLRAAGAVILGKTNVPFMLRDVQTYNDLYGVTSNPWNLSLTPGGSSGGSAAALAAGYVSLELGTDQGGSLRFPAHFCGVYSHKPSLDVVPMRGALSRYDGPFVGAPEKGLWPVAGPMARSAADLQLALGVVAGPDEMAKGAPVLQLRPTRHERLKDFRVLMLGTPTGLPVGEAVRTAMNRLAARLTRSGCRLVDARTPSLAETIRTYIKLDYSGLGQVTPKSELSALAERANALSVTDDSLRALRLRSLVLDAAGQARASEDALRLIAEWRALFEAVDVVIAPVAPIPAFKHDHEPDRWKRTLTVDDAVIDYADLGLWTTVASLAGLPATVAPIGLSRDRLPVGVQIVGPFLGDRSTLRFAQLIEREYGGFIPPPRLSARS
jgi:amidase